VINLAAKPMGELIILVLAMPTAAVNIIAVR